MIGWLAVLPAQTTSLQFEVEYKELPNLIYQLDNVSGMMPWEASGNYLKLWKDNFLTSAEDERWLERWKTQRKKQIRTEETGSGTKFPISMVYRGGDSEFLVRANGLQVNTLSEYGNALRKSLPASYASELSAVVEHFQPRFHEWWRSQGESAGRGFVADLKKILDSAPLREKISKFQQFYQAELPKGMKIPFVLFYRPKVVMEPSSGHHLG